MKEAVKFIQNILKHRSDNPIMDSIVSFVLYFFVIIAVVVGVMFVIKVIPWLVKHLGSFIYRLLVSEHTEEKVEETYHHIDRPLKKLKF